MTKYGCFFVSLELLICSSL